MSEFVTIAITLKDRAALLDKKFQDILLQNYDQKKIEVSISDGYSTDNIKKVIEKWYKHFFQVRYAKSDRSVLPFKIKTNCPACDINAQICNLVTFENVIKTDAEVMFKQKESIKHIVNELNKKDKLLLWADCMYQLDKAGKKEIQLGEAFFCVAFRRSNFIEYKGVDERFAIGFSGEDTTFIRNWEKTYGNVRRLPFFVKHLYHPIPAENPEWKKLYLDYTSPLQYQFQEGMTTNNVYNREWQRPEMIKEEEIFKE